jgi:hypothetical protein
VSAVYWNCILGARIEYALILANVKAWSLSPQKILVGFFFGYSPTISIVFSSYILFCFLSNGTNYMHILASGPEQQAVYFGHVVQVEIEKKGA